MGLRIEEDLKYCPQCREEYLPEINDCIDCGIALVTGVELNATLAGVAAEQANRSMAITAEDTLVAIQSGSVQEMKQLAARLATAFIPAQVGSADGGCGKG